MALRRAWKALVWLAAILFGAPLAYTLAAFAALLLTPRAEMPATGVTIYACDNGVHTDLILPVAAAGIDWRQHFPPRAFTGPVEGFDHVGLGWGSRDFYLNTPTWAEFDIRRAIRSLLWDETVVRADYRPEPRPGEACAQWRVDPETYRRMAGFVSDSLRRNEGRPLQVAAGYGSRDAFFAAEGRYTIIDTCNQWTGQALRLAGAPVAPWVPFSFLVLWHLPAV